MKRDLTPYHRSMPAELSRGLFPSNLLENLFNNSFMAGFNSSMRSDIKENEREYTMEIEIPGFAKEDIHVECQDGYLTVSAINLQDQNEEKANYVRQERQYGKISRSYKIEDIEEDKITAEYRGGILRLSLPKSSGINEKRKRIDIH
ncbi:MAG: Hsp20/alpha crystallin family protein [Syntrophomonas sp.]|nr:Hsp20/alpha crystallin family protein [Syntrophomonas sp.]